MQAFVPLGPGMYPSCPSVAAHGLQSPRLQWLRVNLALEARRTLTRTDRHVPRSAEPEPGASASRRDADDPHGTTRTGPSPYLPLTIRLSGVCVSRTCHPAEHARRDSARDLEARPVITSSSTSVFHVARTPRPSAAEGRSATRESAPEQAAAPAPRPTGAPRPSLTSTDRDQTSPIPSHPTLGSVATHQDTLLARTRPVARPPRTAPPLEAQRQDDRIP